ncbi:TIR domain-containing protein [Microbispora cellulosiformans]|uniref:TIR domain-containing protein n=1 Tax=Microbispora cellulosiformans TaxID=2614688 RepID=A0A5J5K8M7_9ACTN|nr:TIR domain-containing protein [Microbispora cellulosiformans]
MSNQSPETLPGHAFISYIREDKDRVDRLQDILAAAGIRVWRDTEELCNAEPGGSLSIGRGRL